MKRKKDIEAANKLGKALPRLEQRDYTNLHNWSVQASELVRANIDRDVCKIESIGLLDGVLEIELVATGRDTGPTIHVSQSCHVDPHEDLALSIEVVQDYAREVRRTLDQCLTALYRERVREEEGLSALRQIHAREEEGA